MLGDDLRVEKRDDFAYQDQIHDLPGYRFALRHGGDEHVGVDDGIVPLRNLRAFLTFLAFAMSSLTSSMVISEFPLTSEVSLMERMATRARRVESSSFMSIG
ncbi:MAG: hypothetical protein J6328_02215, partial [Bacilli bacterium]|nr:hypothetical protein [Bacilli bacterium]